ncbi:MAG: hypothetical protein GC190_08105 [Alphaproteobacteria bacterium]|nr:hypothetical protein [Alphaproteobacteria bacterium]
MRALIQLSALCVALAFVAAPAADAKPPFTPPGHAKGAFMQPHGHSYDDGYGYGYSYGGKKAKPRGFTAQDDEIVRAYFSGRRRGWSSLPPGIAKNYARGKPLPPGITKRYLPDGLEAQLPYFPGSRYYLVGHDVVLVDTTSRIVVDILKNVFS